MCTHIYYHKHAHTHIILHTQTYTYAGTFKHTHIYTSKYSVERARNILSDIKTNSGQQLSPKGHMQEVFLEAMKQAEWIIKNKLNGLSFSQVYVALGQAIQDVEHYQEKLESVRESTIMVTTE